MSNRTTTPLEDAIRSRIPSTPLGVDRHADRIAEIAAKIAAQFRPDRIVLFGSRAVGTADCDSDIDLMVILRSPGHPLDRAVAIAQAVPHDLPLDILVRTPDQIAIGLDEGDFFITDVMTEGITLVEAGDPELG